MKDVNICFKYTVYQKFCFVLQKSCNDTLSSYPLNAVLHRLLTLLIRDYCTDFILPILELMGEDPLIGEDPRSTL